MEEVLASGEPLGQEVTLPIIASHCGYVMLSIQAVTRVFEFTVRGWIDPPLTLQAIRGNLYYYLEVSASSLSNSSLTLDMFNNFPTGLTIRFQGATFRLWTGLTSDIKCKFGNIVSAGSLLDVNSIFTPFTEKLTCMDIQCVLPSQNLYGAYQVSVTLDGSTYTNETLLFTYVCDQSVVCSGRGVCLSNGSCTCNTGWKGASCNIPTCGDGLQNAGESVSRIIVCH